MAITVSEEQRQQTRQMDVESLAKFVFRLLKQRLREEGDLPDCSWTSLGLRERLFSDADPTQTAYDRVRFLEVIVLLERRGLVIRDDSHSWLRNLPLAEFAVHLTTIGKKSDFDEILLLVDKPQEIVDTLEQEVGRLDDVVRQYYLESLRAYQEELYIASVFCLGAASERAIHWLAEAIESYSEKYQKEIEKRRSGEISRLIKYLSDSVIPNIFEDSDELKDRLDRLAGIYRENRNEAGHPKNVAQNWSRGDQEILLLQFRRYITTICKAIAECRVHNKPTKTNG